MTMDATLLRPDDENGSDTPPSTKTTRRQGRQFSKEDRQKARLQVLTGEKAQDSPLLAPLHVKRLVQWKPINRERIAKCWLKKASPKAAIRCQCLDCMGEDVNGIAQCGDRCCPLWHLRPYQRIPAVSKAVPQAAIAED
jgi:hypothetical protein